METLRLYHGSNQRFDRVDLTRSRDRRDFGRGFYLTTLRDQAAAWAATVQSRYGGLGPLLYTFDLDLADSLAVQVYEGLTLEWLHMVKDNRLGGGVQHSFDVVRGPVANDNTILTVSLYVDGIIDAESALRQLSFFKPNDQVSVHTPAALAHLRFLGREQL